MFETERLPSPLVAYAEDLDELLVPSRFNVESFAKSGIPAKKLHTLAQVSHTHTHTQKCMRASTLPPESSMLHKGKGTVCVHVFAVLCRVSTRLCLTRYSTVPLTLLPWRAPR